MIDSNENFNGELNEQTMTRENLHDSIIKQQDSVQTRNAKLIPSLRLPGSVGLTFQTLSSNQFSVSGISPRASAITKQKNLSFKIKG